MIKRSLCLLLGACMVLAVLSPAAMANGSFSISVPEPVEVNGVTATVTLTPEGSAAAGTQVEATVTLTGAPDNTEIHSVRVRSTKAAFDGDAQNTLVMAGTDSDTSPVSKTFWFVMPSENVDDLVLEHTILLPDYPIVYFSALGTDDITIYQNESTRGVSDGPSVATTLTINKPHIITGIRNYHWNAGSTAYQDHDIRLVHSDGTIYGPWSLYAAGGSGRSNVYWYAFPNEILKAGEYTLVDSDNGTWSWASDTGNKGICVVRGISIDQTVSELTIFDAIAPINGDEPATQIAETEQYTGAIAWAPSHEHFQPGQNYTATITLTAKEGYIFDGVAENSFVVPCAKSATNQANSGVITATFKAPPSGYVTDGKGVMAYSYCSTDSFDIQGFFHDDWKQTTWGNYGYDVDFVINGQSRISGAVSNQPRYLGNTGLTLVTDFAFVSDGKAIRIQYTVKNEGSEPAQFSFGSHADIQIGGDDSAPITVFDESLPAASNRGFKMVSGYESDRNGQGDYAQFNFFGKRSAGVTDVDTFWFGVYHHRTQNLFVQVEDTSLTGKDSGMAYSWKDRLIGPGETQTYSVVIGIGGADSSEVLGFSVSYDDNVPDAVIQVPATQEKLENVALELSGEIPVRDEYLFEGWNTEPDGSGTSYNPGDVYTLNADLVLYAQWREVESESEPESEPEPKYTGPFVFYRITATAGEGGDIAPSGQVMVGESFDQAFAIVPDAGYLVSDVLIDGKSAGSVTSYTFKRVEAGHTIEAVFSKDAGVSPGNPFEDVARGDWFFDSVLAAFRGGLMVGTGPATFDPSGVTNRAMIPTILHRMEGSPSPSQLENFADVPWGLWYAEGVLWSAENGIVLGIGEGLFDPEAGITREDLAVMLYRYAGYKGCDVSQTANLSEFVDGDRVSDWALEGVRWAVGAGLLQGKGEKVLDPQGPALRSEVAAILMRFLDR